MTQVPGRLRLLVVARAGARCEYRGLAQEVQEATFHVDHIVPVAAGGATTAENLALACVSCSLHKHARRSAVDPATGRAVALFHPRRQRWRSHFRWDGCRVVGTTPTGRATIALLRVNRAVVVAIRAEDVRRGRHPPPA